MIDNNRFQELFEEYKSELKGARWDDEKFKWQAIKGFQDHWDIEAVDFCTMLKNSLDKTFNLLASTHYFPGKMIKEFANNINYGPEPDTIAFLLKQGVNIASVQVTMEERMAGTSYLNFGKSIIYMLRMLISILLINNFRKRS